MLILRALYTHSHAPAKSLCIFQCPYTHTRSRTHAGFALSLTQTIEYLCTHTHIRTHARSRTLGSLSHTHAPTRGFAHTHAAHTHLHVYPSSWTAAPTSTGEPVGTRNSCSSSEGQLRPYRPYSLQALRRTLRSAWVWARASSNRFGSGAGLLVPAKRAHKPSAFAFQKFPGTIIRSVKGRLLGRQTTNVLSCVLRGNEGKKGLQRENRLAREHKKHRST